MAFWDFSTVPATPASNKIKMPPRTLITRCVVAPWREIGKPELLPALLFPGFDREISSHYPYPKTT